MTHISGYCTLILWIAGAGGGGICTVCTVQRVGAFRAELTFWQIIFDNFPTFSHSPSPHYPPPISPKPQPPNGKCSGEILCTVHAVQVCKIHNFTKKFKHGVVLFFIYVFALKDDKMLFSLVFYNSTLTRKM